MKIHPGDSVRFLNEKGGGVVTAILNTATVTVAIEEGFEIPVPVNQLVIVSKDEKQATERRQSIRELSREELMILVEKDLARRKISLKQSDRTTRSETWEVDLHAEELTENSSQMSNAEIVILQLSHFRKVMDKAILSGVKKLVVIHGVGGGVLKSEIRNALKAYSGIRFYDADERMYGKGATEVLII